MRTLQSTIMRCTVLGVVAAVATIACGDSSTGPTPPRVQLGEIGFISAGDSSTCITNSLAVAFCWGANHYGQLGDGTQQNRIVPDSIPGGLRFTQISAGDHACGVTLAGAAYCWGQGSAGELGNGGAASSMVPVPVSGGLTFSDVDVGGSSCGSTGLEIYCWGPNGEGQLGVGDKAQRTTPALVTSGLNFPRISAGVRTACVVNPGNTAYCWGRGEDGELGTGSFGVSSDAPVPVSGGHSFNSISVGGDASGAGTVCGVTLGGSIYCWGGNASGQIGDGTKTRRNAPVLVPISGNFGEVVVGSSHTCARDNAGVVSCWGEGGLLGDGTSTQSSVPVQVAGNRRFATITGGARHTCGRGENDDLLYCWGDNTFGQLGDGTTKKRTHPVKVIGQ